MQNTLFVLKRAAKCSGQRLLESEEIRGDPMSFHVPEITERRQIEANTVGGN